MRIAVTGGNGFIGSALVPELRARGHEVVLVPRKLIGHASALSGCSTVVHLAAIAHIDAGSRTVSRSSIDQVNVKLPLSQLSAAQSAGVRRLIFLSSIKAVGERTSPGNPIRTDSTPAPSSIYGTAKRDAEEALRKYATNIELQVIRPPLVYGPGVKANFHTLLRVLNYGIPLPFARIDNMRSYVGIRNLVAFVAYCVEFPGRTPVILHVGDGQDLSTPALVIKLAAALSKPARLFPIPKSAAFCAARCIGAGAFVDRLWGSLQLEVNETFAELCWSPPYSVESELNRTATFFQDDDIA